MNIYDQVYNYLYKVAEELWHKHGMAYEQACLATDPIWRIVSTGRTSYGWMKALLETKPYLVARRIAKGGSYDEVVARVKELVDKQM